jgi:glycosyltransferase involved in cell wall biosynthesis
VRLLFVYLQRSSFVREDLKILGGEHDIRTFQFGAEGKPGPLEFAITLVRQSIWLLREMPRCDAVFGWFADYHMVLPVLFGRLFRKPVVVAVGGFDAISLPTLKYGVVLSRWRWPLARLVLGNASMLLPVSQSLIYSENGFSEFPRTSAQGIKAFIPNIKTPARVVPTGYDPQAWRMGPPTRAPVVSTMGMIDSDRTLRRKGIDVVIEVARALPNVQFRIVGIQNVWDVRQRYHPPENVELIPPVPREHLVRHYHETSVYIQLSRAEGLPNVLCEAMLCGCIPVGSRVFGIPDGIGEAGFIVDTPDPAEIAPVVRAALSAGPERRTAARDHILEHFHIDRRRRSLQEIMMQVTSKRER